MKLPPGIYRFLEDIAAKFQRLYIYVFGVTLSSFTGSTNNVAGFTDTHVVPNTIQRFMAMYETFKSPAIMADATSYRKSKMTAN